MLSTHPFLKSSHKLIFVLFALLVACNNEAFSQNGFLSSEPLKQQKQEQEQKQQQQERQQANPFTQWLNQLLGSGNTAAVSINGLFGASAPVIAASSAGSAWTGSSVDGLNRWLNQSAPHIADEVRSETTLLQTGSDPVEKYGPNRHPGMKDSGMSPNVEGSLPETVARRANPNQQPPLLPHHNEMTEYERIGGGYGEWGPPKRPYYQHHPQDNTSLSAPANTATLTGLPTWITDGATSTSNVVHLASQANAAYQGAQEQNNPSLHTAQAQFQGALQHAANSTGKSAEAQFGSNLATVRTHLINVANEGAGTPTSANAPKKTLNQAIWMVQQMWKGVYLPMAILFLLPGAVATQVIGVIKFGMNKGAASDEDIVSPFTGILRAAVAIFLIPATQMIVSYSIDVGNSMTYEVTHYIQADAISGWADSLFNPNGSQTMKQFQDTQNSETGMQAMYRAGFSTISTLLNYALMILCAYQVVMVSYLFLLGPIAASFLAWPTGVGKLFKPVFSNWLEGLFNLVLWRFWWCVILLCMSTRIQWLIQMGQYDPKSPWEQIVFIAFTVMLTYVPFMALDFKPGDMVDALLEKTKGTTGE